MLRAKLIGGALASIVAGAAWADDQRSLSFSVGQDYGVSDFEGQGETPINFTSLSGRLAIEDWSFSVSTAYADIGVSPDVSFVGAGGQEFLVSGGEATSGFSDIILGISGTPWPETTDTPGVTVSGSVKLPTADEDAGLGSGATDVRVAVELYKSIGPVTAYGYVGGTFRGESDTEVEPGARLGGRFFQDRSESGESTVVTQNSAEAGFGVQRSLTDDLVGSLGYDYRGAAVEGGEASHEVSALLSYSLNEATSVTGYVYRGQTDTSTSTGGGLLVTRRVALW